MKQSTPPTESKLTYSIPEAATKVGACRSTMYQEIAVGRLVARKLRGRTIILSADLEAYLAALPRMACVEGQDHDDSVSEKQARKVAVMP